MDPTTFPDERLELIFTCCHPALSVDPQVALTLLADQGRSLLDTAEIAEGREALDRALALLGRGLYVVQATIASLHADQPRDWPQIAALYGELSRLTDSPVVELNRAVAVAEAQGPEAGLEIVDRLPLEDYRYLHATRGELLRRLGRTEEARADHQDAHPGAECQRLRRTVGADGTTGMSGLDADLGRRHLERVLNKYLRHYNDARPHRGLRLRPPSSIDIESTPTPSVVAIADRVRRRDRLEGLVHEYYQVAA